MYTGLSYTLAMYAKMNKQNLIHKVFQPNINNQWYEWIQIDGDEGGGGVC